MEEKAPNCHQCQHFKVSWDSRFPKSCRRFGFRCRQLPSLEVLAATGKHCCFFVDRPEAVASLASPVLPGHCTLSVMG
ncbi:MAG: uracil-DNA glycosylase [Candidatus Eremiobacterota bacterium]